jgi:futalosine hydrolase
VSRIPQISTGAWLLVVAAAAEARAVLAGLQADSRLASEEWRLHRLGNGFDIIVSGIGKANAAAAAAQGIDPSRHAAVVSIGVAGALPGTAGDQLVLGDVVAATASVYADEGLQTPEAFVDCGQMGFPLGPFLGNRIEADPGVLEVLRRVAGVEGAVATVSTCSGTDVLAQQVRERTGAVAESMEGAAVAQVARRLGVACGELRVISNSTGDRGGQQWDLKGALAKLEQVVRDLAQRRHSEPMPDR